MKKFLKNKINIFLLLLSIVVVTGFAIILKVEAGDRYVIKKQTEELAPLALESKFMTIEPETVNTDAADLKYVLRATGDTPMGFVDSTLVRCFVDMGPVDFSPRYKFKSQDPNGTRNRMYGFSTPLVGDLNGDGKPEIVVLGITDNQSGLNATASYIYILNGQTGKEIVKFTLPITWNLRGNYWHGSPCQLALMKLDKDSNRSQIVCTLGYTGGSAASSWIKRVVCWETNDRTFDSSVSTTDNSKLTHKWTSDTRYDMYGNGTVIPNDDNYSKPLPHVVDIDGDGTPEIIVYNKIYNAENGALIMRLEELAATRTNATAFVGQNRNAAEGDHDIPFAYIYDIDFDGKYDIIAGGKVYYDIDLVAKTYKIKTMSGLSDGYTAVADVNGDGLPEVVMASYPSSIDNITVNVWTPNLVAKNPTGEIVPGSGTPELLATRSFSTSATVTGNHSNIFVGDIDGQIQNGKKFPEISILSGRPNITTVRSAIHPCWVGTVPNSYITTVGALFSLTWDDNASNVNDRLKFSFILEHDDTSYNTGFTLFDFDNDGIQDICYRDEEHLRIISATKSYVPLNESSPNVIRFKQVVRSYTGFENPVVVDVDGDSSADMIVMGHAQSGNHDFSYVYAVEGTYGDLAPAPRVWNQYSYSPLKVNDDLTIPSTLFHPLDDDYYVYKSEEDKANGVGYYLYNNTIAQVPLFSINADKIAKPIVSIPDAKILDLSINIVANTVNFKLTNNGDASLNPEDPINVYENGVHSLSLIVGAGGLFVGDTLSYSIPLSGSLPVYTIVVGATIDADKNMTPAGKYIDCNWADNIDEVATFLAKDDAATVMQYGTVLIDVLANDILENACATQILNNSMITTPAGQGVMSGEFGSLQIVSNKLLYTAPQAYRDNNVVELSYTLTCQAQTRTAKVYIYILESCSFGFASCAGSPYNVCVNKKPAGIKFEWYDNTDNFIGEESPIINSLTTDLGYYVKPVFTNVTNSPYKGVAFPKGKITIKALSSSGDLKAKWTGETDHNWNNPSNWVQVLTNGSEVPVTWAPIGCVDVIIPNGVKNYPELVSVAECGTIHMEDRAMISGIHHLVYVGASVDFTPIPSEKDRFAMWSAPLKDVYSGDYHFLNSSNQPDWGHVYMNFFQSANPDYPGSVETEKTFTATFGSTGTPLPLGKAFNVKVLSGKNGSFAFPQSATSYVDVNGSSSGNLSRTNAKRFITDGAIGQNGEISIPVSGNNSYSLIQVVNPFMAYLKVHEFLAANSSVIQSSYSVWDGDVNAEFVSVLSYEDEHAQRYVIDDIDQISFETSPAYIAPLQSFFVRKKDASAVTSLIMNASMTTTVTSDNNGSYVLRSAERGSSDDVANLLRITASNGKEDNSTVVLRKTGARQEYNPGEDVEKAFNHGVPVSVYTMSGNKKALAINASEDFEGDVTLGLRMREINSPVTLSFSGLNGFGQKVSLIDHAQNNKVIDLTKENRYVFTVSNEGSKDVTELNNRFSLRFGEGSATSVEDINNEINIRAFNGGIIVSSQSIFNRVEVVSLSGMKVYDNLIPASYIQIPLLSGQMYIVKVIGEKRQVIRKVIVR